MSPEKHGHFFVAVKRYENGIITILVTLIDRVGMNNDLALSVICFQISIVLVYSDQNVFTPSVEIKAHYPWLTANDGVCLKNICGAIEVHFDH